MGFCVDGRNSQSDERDHPVGGPCTATKERAHGRTYQPSSGSEQQHHTGVVILRACLVYISLRCNRYVEASLTPVARAALCRGCGSRHLVSKLFPSDVAIGLARYLRQVITSKRDTISTPGRRRFAQTGIHRKKGFQAATPTAPWSWGSQASRHHANGFTTRQNLTL